MNTATRVGINSLTTNDIAEAIVLLKHRAGVIGLFRTMHALEAGVKEVGWELAAELEAKHHTAARDAAARSAARAR